MAGPDRWDLLLAGIALLGVLAVLTAPPEPIYGVSVSEVGDEAPDEEVRAVEDLEGDERDLFQRARESRVDSYGEPPALTGGYVRDDGDVYRVYGSVSESNLYTLLQQPAGIGLLVVALGSMGVRRLR